jgi:hypothetical protein
MYGSARVFHVKRFYVPLGASVAVAVVFAVTFALAQPCPAGYTFMGGRCVQNANSAYLASGANIAIGPANSTINGTVNIQNATPTTGATSVNIALGPAQTSATTSITLTNAGNSTLPWVNFVIENGANNAITATIPGLTSANGTCVVLYLNHTLQAGANTFALNGGTAMPIYSHFGGVPIAKAYTTPGFLINLCNSQGAAWLDMSQ